ncbi:hypothetical protein [Desulfotalea psychrophila]|uniref:hypothetical protein n=1 Tax=Desulfotalea psychrophila TaxID=84980 RepID=UPI0012EAA9AD|nr:hypothetical protein [Desulfotalea psychrophila]
MLLPPSPWLVPKDMVEEVGCRVVTIGEEAKTTTMQAVQIVQNLRITKVTKATESTY